MLRKNGRLNVLDFGLARLSVEDSNGVRFLSTSESNTDLTMAATMTSLRSDPRWVAFMKRMGLEG